VAQVGLIHEHEEKFSILPIGSVLDHPPRDLARRKVPRLDGRPCPMTREGSIVPIAAATKKIE
jgi:hypothetical protein